MNPTQSSGGRRNHGILEITLNFAVGTRASLTLTRRFASASPAGRGKINPLGEGRVRAPGEAWLGFPPCFGVSTAFFRIMGSPNAIRHGCVRILRFVALFIALASPLMAQAETGLAFKGLVLGGGITPLLADARVECQPLRTPFADRVCGLRQGAHETIAGAPVNSIFWYVRSDRLARIVINLDARHFDAVTQALVQRHGPARDEMETVRTLDGREHRNRVLTWQRDGGRLVAERYAGQINQSRIRFIDERAEATPRVPRAPQDDL